ncbi:hypothetical protein J6590_050487 [Homalodisca vitripennis]|nr:hypothetical protein J6590_050487 [Homalodisca vitripennis]
MYVPQSALKHLRVRNKPTQRTEYLVLSVAVRRLPQRFREPSITCPLRTLTLMVCYDFWQEIRFRQTDLQWRSEAGPDRGTARRGPGQDVHRGRPCVAGMVPLVGTYLPTSASPLPPRPSLRY